MLIVTLLWATRTYIFDVMHSYALRSHVAP